jgi:hypothetical protein
MAQFTIQTSTALAITPSANTCNAGGDYVIPSASGVTRVVLRFINAAGSSYNVVLDDPTSVTPTGATAWNPDVTTAVPNGAQRYLVLTTAEVLRFTDPATGRISWTYSATPTSMTCEVVGVG